MYLLPTYIFSFLSMYLLPIKIVSVLLLPMHCNVDLICIVQNAVYDQVIKYFEISNLKSIDLHTFFHLKKTAVMLANKQSSWIIKPPLRSSLKSLFFFNLADRSDAIADTCVAKGTTGPCRQWHWVLWLNTVCLSLKIGCYWNLRICYCLVSCMECCPWWKRYYRW